MTPRHPPRFAIWLMETFNVGQALTGDVIERYARGRSRVWFWRQALLAIALGSVKDLVEHKLLFARALLVGYASLWALTNLAYMVVPLFMDVAPVRQVFVLRLLMFAIVMLIGWLIGRLHRPHSGAMVLGFVAVVWLLSGPQMVRNISNALQHERFRQYVEAWFMNRVYESVFMVAGGILSGGSGDRGVTRSKTEQRS
jgi:hypothetical protein